MGYKSISLSKPSSKDRFVRMEKRKRLRDDVEVAVNFEILLLHDFFVFTSINM